MEYSNLFVCLMGMGTVFVGLICIVILVSVMSSIVRKTDKMTSQRSGTPVIPDSAAPVREESVKENEITPELIAAISAAIAETMGTDVSAIRIRSLRKV